MLREFLYVDTDKVRSILAQLDEGVEEEVRVTEKDAKKLSIGAKNILNHDTDSGTESSVMRSLADAVFPSLESMMESSGYLADISDVLQDGEYWLNGLQGDYPPGSFVRITAPARLFDSRYLLRIFTSLSVAANGYVALNPESAGASPRQGRGAGKAKQGVETANPSPEDEIEDFPPSLFGDQLRASQLRGFSKLTRAIFNPGLSLIMNPTGDEKFPVTVRLQEGTRFLESDAEVLFARYGLFEQEWTVVGTIGSFYPPEDELPVVNSWGGSREGSVMDRAAITKSINAMAANVGRFGFADIPQSPGFSIVPFAVYRSILSARPLPVVPGAHV